jgi:ribonucleotide reductase beta subunit family protein with ferritin-like domain
MAEILQQKIKRHSIYPIFDGEIWAWYKKLEGLAWTAQEVDMSTDLSDWLKMDAPRREYYTHILAFFAVADELVLDNINSNFIPWVELKECKYFYCEQAKQECVHSEAYSIQVETLLTDDGKKNIVFNSIEHMPAIADMATWISNWANCNNSFPERLAAFAIAEGLLFQGHFVSIQLLKEDNIMPGLVSYNEFISRDEGIHCLFACFLLSKRVVNRPPESAIHNMMTAAVHLVDKFMIAALESALNVTTDGNLFTIVKKITPTLMQQYIRFSADVICSQMGYDMIYHVDNPYPETIKISLNEVAKTNFFEHRPTQYQNFTSTGALELKIDPIEIYL